MRLTAFSDFSLRVLIYLGVHDKELATIAGIAAAYGVSENHLMKVVHHLARKGYIETVRGRGGGLRLARKPAAIRIGEVVRSTETNAILAECFDRESSECRIEPACVLRGLLGQAQEAFFAELDRHSLADLVAPRVKLARLLVPG
ncbi:MAG: Rrf2 family transcriptional regulator [Burkholderiales bacterium]|nr:Rrf2 family transcriptional regulator [Burkholderiales bacterium]